MHHRPRPRDDVLLVGVEQVAERQAVLDPDQSQRRRERQDRGEDDRRPSPRSRAAQPARPRAVRHRRGGRRRAEPTRTASTPARSSATHVVAGRRREVGDRELAGRDVGQQVEDPLERRPRRRRPPAARAGRSPGRSARATSVERLLVVDVDDDLEPELVRPPRAGPRGAPRRRAPRRRSGTRRRRPRCAASGERVDPEEDRQAGRVADAGDGRRRRRAPRRPAPRPLEPRRRRRRAR